MATLTAAGINCSNGTLDGQYTGTASTNTSFPVGSYLFGASANILNSSVTLYEQTVYYPFPPGGPARTLAGTWRARGYQQSGCSLFQLFQRFS